MKLTATSGVVVMDRRAQPRYPLELEVDLNPAGAGPDSTLRGRTRNVSSTGVYLVRESEAPPEGSRVEVALWLPVGNEQQPIWGEGSVVRIDRRDDLQVGLAVRFDRIDFAADDTETFT